MSTKSAKYVLAFDTETALIRPGLLAPPLVCVTWQRRGQEARIEHHVAVEPRLRSWLEDINSTHVIVGHNVAYDMAVVCERFPTLRPLVFRAYDEDRVTDTMIRQQLIDTANGEHKGSVSAKGKLTKREYSLEALGKRCAGMQLQKDAWRLSYAEFIDVPLSRWAERARVVQGKAAVRLRELEARLLQISTAKNTRKVSEEEKALLKEIEGLRSMVQSDPEQCVRYPLDDARATLAVYEAQELHAAFLEDQFRQARAAFMLHLNSAWGLRTDAQGVASLRRSIEAEFADVDEELKAVGLVRADGVRDTKAAKRRMIEACTDLGIPVVRTDGHFLGRGEDPATTKCKCKDADGKPLPWVQDEKGEWSGHPDCFEHVSLDADACERAEDDILSAYAERSTLGKQLSNDIAALEQGAVYPIHTRYGFAATGRTTSSKPNIQNQSKREGFREAFVPRPGRVFIQCDFPGLELYTWAQCCKTWFGFSKLADALNAGKDAHLILAANLLGISYEDSVTNKKRSDVKNGRDRSKPGNFGFAGGMGVPKFLTSTRKAMGRKAFEALGLDETSGKVLKETWKRTWPEAKLHFEQAAALCEAGGGLGRVVVPFTGFHRGGTTFCATCNTPFQGLGAACAKEAGWLICKAQYIGTPSRRFLESLPPAARAGAVSPLFNARSVAMVHDEYIAEVDEAPTPVGDIHDAAMELAALMVEGANKYLRDVMIPIEKMEPLAMRRWSKKAEPILNEEGRVIPWAA